MMYPTHLYLFVAYVVISGGLKIPQRTLNGSRQHADLLEKLGDFLTAASLEIKAEDGTNSQLPDTFDFHTNLVLKEFKQTSLNKNDNSYKEASKFPHGRNTIGIKRDAEGYLEDTLLNVTERAASYGYVVQEYTVKTQDGYLLGLQRIRSTSQSIRVPVLLMHGLLLSAACFIDAGPKTGLAYLLADAGHDVWLGNARGNFYSRAHVTLNPDHSAEYWQFSADEIGIYDLPATIDKVLNTTGSVKLNYIGYSQGAGTFLIMCSELPHYCTKANVFIALSPSSRHLMTKSPVFRILCEFYERNEQVLSDAGVYEVMPKNGWVQKLLMFFCNKSDSAAQLCEIFKDVLDGHHPGSIKKASLRSMVASFPAGTSVRNIVRYSQSLKTRTIHKFDYGSEKNLIKYGSKVPPKYNLSSVTVPVVVVYGRNDGIVDVGDVTWLVRRLPNVVEAYEVKDPLWTHMDVPYSRHVPRLLFPKVEQYLNKYV